MGATGPLSSSGDFVSLRYKHRDILDKLSPPLLLSHLPMTAKVMYLGKSCMLVNKCKQGGSETEGVPWKVYVVVWWSSGVPG